MANIAPSFVRERPRFGIGCIAVGVVASICNQAVITFIDDAGYGHVLVLGGADRQIEGKPSAGVVRY
jgi:hypothetical protein